ncbi:MAG: DUF4956 domain-containing protein [Verrucomicrobia bacterium]|nr:MAG: DUF4956 domain-containing protein [Verrucomicrobiota bacterium]
MEWLFRGDYAQAPVSVPLVLLGLLLAFVCGQTLAWIYMWTHSGLSYSRTFVNSLIVIPVLVAAVMMVLAHNLVTAFGMMAVFAIVRFRNILRDTLDTSYILAGLVIGMACGTQRYPVAILVTVVVVAILLYLWMTAFGSRHRYDVIVNLHWARPLAELEDLRALFWKYSRRTHCASQRYNEAQGGTDLSYRLLLRDPDRMEDMLNELRRMQGISRVSSLQAEDESEI